MKTRITAIFLLAVVLLFACASNRTSIETKLNAFRR